MGVNLLALANICGIPDEALATSDQVKLHLGIPAEKMALLYNGFDVLASPSYGEGFGVPILEAQACGVPVIVTDWTAMTELMGAGWLVDGDPFLRPAARRLLQMPVRSGGAGRFRDGVPRPAVTSSCSSRHASSRWLTTWTRCSRSSGFR
jgi:glycosyltransferase involved in cell wall biosynthesis